MNKMEKIASFTIELPEELCDGNVDMMYSVLADMLHTYAKKNHDYGNSFDKGMDSIGYAYGLGRLYDKLNRIINLLINKEKSVVEDESVEDTLLDMANYSAMFLAYIRKFKHNDALSKTN